MWYVRSVFVEPVPSDEVSEFFLVPLGNFAAIFVFDVLHLDVIFSAQFKPYLIAGMH